MPNFIVTTELFYDGIWNNISADIRVPAGVEIQWGRGDGASAAEASQLSLVINNAGGKYSPRNPASPLFGKIGRNTRIRVSISGDLAFTGEVSSWPTRWNIPGRNLWMPITAAGLLRRINQGTQPAYTSLRSLYESTTPVIYWPLTDGETAVKGAPDGGTWPFSSFFESPTTQVISTFGKGNLASHLSPSFLLDDCTTASAGMVGYCQGSSLTPNAVAFEFVYRANPQAEGAPAGFNTWLIYLETGEPADQVGFPINDFYLLTFNTSLNQLDVQGPNFAGGSTSPNAFPFNDGNMHHIRVQATQVGADVTTKVYLDGVDTGIAATTTAYTLKQTRRIVLQYDRTAGKDLLAFGHLILWETTTNIPTIAATSLAAFGYTGETAGRRIERLCSEQGVPFNALAVNLDDSQPMGLLFEDQFSAQLTECEATDQGLIYEQRGSLAIGYRTRASLYAQTPAAVINYELGELSPPLDPVDDDQTTRNDVFAQRREGSSSRVTVTTGPLSVADPPNGVGRYKDEYQVNVQTDGMLDGIAAWRVRLGTIDAARFPQVTVNRNNPAVAASPLNLSTTIRSVNVGDLIRITSGPKLRAAAGVYDDIDLLVLGGRRYCDGFNDLFTFNCRPYEPYAAAKFDTARYDTAGSTLTAGVTATDTSLSVASPNTLWTTAGGSFPFDITVAGERMTVTNITGATSPQTFTVTRSVNGVLKAQAINAAVRLFKTPRYAL